MEEHRIVEISGAVAAVVYQNEDNGYTVLRLDTGASTVTVVGCLPMAAAGERMTLSGSWVTHPSHGDQFKAVAALRQMPTDPAGIFLYLASGAVKGVGPATAKLIVDRFGSQALEIMETAPEELAGLKGISAKKALEISRELRRQGSLRRLMEFLVARGFRSFVPLRLYQLYGEDAMEALHENPYILAGPGIGADFAQADALALSLGFDGAAPQRAEAAILFELSHNLNRGHCFIPREKLIAASAQLIELDSTQLSPALDRLIAGESVVEEALLGLQACYLSDVYRAECFVAERLLSMCRPAEAGRLSIDRLLEETQAELGLTYAPQQREAVRAAARSHLLVLTGGPGTGKTTTVRAILALYGKMGLRAALCAPTGRAAKRLSQLTGEEALTLHRLLEAGFSDDALGEKTVFFRNDRNPLEADVVILDEASMVDLLLMRALLAALRPSARLVLVGDADQLPSVGPGNLFADIIRSGTADTIRLDQVFRQATESAIVRNAHLINSGSLPELKNKGGDFFFLNRRSPEAVLDTVAQLCSTRLPQNMGISPNQIQVLSPTRLRETGTAALNRRLQDALNPPTPGKKEYSFEDFLFRCGDKVMQTRNNYDILWKSPLSKEAGAGIFNGDTGYIQDINQQEQFMQIDFDGRIVSYPFSLLRDLEPAFAITVHKSQGSEYQAVILTAFSGAASLLTRSVLYTAVTRARELLIIVGEESVLRRMVENDRPQRRYSGLRARLAGV